MAVGQEKQISQEKAVEKDFLRTESGLQENLGGDKGCPPYDYNQQGKDME